VALLADAAASQDVEILNFAKPPETPPASAQLPAEAAGLKPQPPAPPPAAPTAAAPTAPASPIKPKPAAPSQAAPAEPAQAADEDVDR
jgi:hypothetical protein